MKKEKIIENIKKMIADKNCYINSCNGKSSDEKLRICMWEYARENLIVVLNMIENSEF